MDMRPKFRPLLLAQHDHRNLPDGKVLLVAHVLVASREHFEISRLSICEQISVAKCVPPLLGRCPLRVADQKWPYRYGPYP